MIQSSSLHHNSHDGAKIIRSHKLTPHETVTVFCIIEGKKENIVSVLEDHFLEILSGVEWNIHEIETDFSYIAEHFNHFIKNISPDDLTDISVVFACNIKNLLTFSIIGNAQVILTEDDTISIISWTSNEKCEFHSISSGEVPSWGTIYLSSSQIDSILWEDILLELADLAESQWVSTGESILHREYNDNLHIFRITNQGNSLSWKRKNIWENQAILSTIEWAFSRILHMSRKISWKETIQKIPLENKWFQYWFLSVWIVILFVLLYTLLHSISTSIYTSSSDSKNQLLEAQNLIEQSQKLVNNPSAFNTNIKKAEEILFTLRDKKEHLSDTQDLLSQIEAMKKEVNDIQIVDMSKYSTIIKFNWTEISPIWIFEKNKKLALIGQNWIIQDYARDMTISKIASYPPWENALWFDTEDNGNFFILTNNSRVLSPRWNDLTYITVSWQDTWEKAKAIKTFNGNLYLINKEGNQIFKHKPWMNGFSSQTSVLPEWSASGIIDIGIDGGMYILTQDGKILRYISGKTDVPKSLAINKVPGEYNIGELSPTQLFVKSNLSYLYILSGNNIWIFQPDSKRFQDVSSLTYIAQLEIQTNEEMRGIYVPRDGTIDLTTSLWVYELTFEIVDGKLILR